MLPARSFLRLCALLVWCGLCALIAWPLHMLGLNEKRQRIAFLGYKGCAKILGLRVQVTGEIAQNFRLMLVSNHISYLDIFVLGSLLPLRFAPKAEIARWPLVGGLSKLAGCIFIERRASAARHSGTSLKAALEEGVPLCLFPESTTGEGKRLLPFKSALLDVEQATVQPVRLRYTHINGLPIDSAQLHRIAWYGDMELWPHAKELLNMARIGVQVQFLPPIEASTQPDRKALAATCRHALHHA